MFIVINEKFTLVQHLHQAKNWFVHVNRKPPEIYLVNPVTYQALQKEYYEMFGYGYNPQHLDFYGKRIKRSYDVMEDTIEFY